MLLECLEAVKVLFRKIFLLLTLSFREKMNFLKKVDAKYSLRCLAHVLEYGGFKIHLTYLEFHLLSEKQSASFSFGHVHEL